MSKRDLYLEHLAKVPLFSLCSKRELAMIARRGTDVVVEAGRTLTREGSAGYEFFVIIDGKATVTREGREVAVLGPGDFFGELALLDRAPRNATVTATTRMELVVVSSREFRTLLEEAPTLTYKLLAAMAHRLRELDLAPVG